MRDKFYPCDSSVLVFIWGLNPQKLLKLNVVKEKCLFTITAYLSAIFHICESRERENGLVLNKGFSF